MKRFVFKGVLAARTNRLFFSWQQRHYADPPERPSYQPHTTERVISGMKSEQTSRFSAIVRIPIGTPTIAHCRLTVLSRPELYTGLGAQITASKFSCHS